MLFNLISNPSTVSELTVNGNLILQDASSNKTTIQEGASGNITITLPASTGTLALTSDLAATASFAFQESATGSVNDSTFAGYAGKRVVLNGSSATTYELPDAVADDVGKTWVIHNASNASITLDVDTNSQTVKHLTGAAVTSKTSDMTIVAGGVAELTCIAADTYIIVGGGIS